MKTTILSAVSAFLLTSQVLIAAPSSNLTGKVIVDGSSTVFPISEAVGEEFQIQNPSVKVAIAVSGTGGGFKKFCKGEIDLTGASRPIESSEIQACEKAGVPFVELPVAYDGITVVTSQANSWLKSLTIAELKKIWDAGSTVTKWNQVRPEFPAETIKLFGPGHDSGTFDYFTHAVNGKEKSSRADFTASEDDNMLVMGVRGEKNSLGYFGYAYYESNKAKLKLVGVDAGLGIVLPSRETISSGKYRPLSRPLFVYVAETALHRPEVRAFTDFYLKNTAHLSEQVGYVSLGEKINLLVQKRYEQRVLGSIYLSKNKELSLDQLLSLQAARKK